jgi:hypothetical protein
LQFHSYYLVNSRDALYSTNGSVLRISPTGSAGHQVGNELDVLFDFHLNRHQDLLFSYSRFFAGNYIRATGNPMSANLFFGQYSYRW